MGYLYLIYKSGRRIRMSGVVTRLEYNRELESIEVFYNSTDSVVYWTGGIERVEIREE